MRLKSFSARRRPWCMARAVEGQPARRMIVYETRLPKRQAVAVNERFADARWHGSTGDRSIVTREEKE
jgi:hypothetical protein